MFVRDAFYHPGCVSKHKTYKGKELFKCEGPFERIDKENGINEMVMRPSKELLMDKLFVSNDENSGVNEMGHDDNKNRLSNK